MKEAHALSLTRSLIAHHHQPTYRGTTLATAPNPRDWYESVHTKLTGNNGEFFKDAKILGFSLNTWTTSEFVLIFAEDRKFCKLTCSNGSDGKKYLTAVPCNADNQVEENDAVRVLSLLRSLFENAFGKLVEWKMDLAVGSRSIKVEFPSDKNFAEYVWHSIWEGLSGKKTTAASRGASRVGGSDGLISGAAESVVNVVNLFGMG